LHYKREKYRNCNNRDNLTVYIAINVITDTVVNIMQAFGGQAAKSELADATRPWGEEQPMGAPLAARRPMGAALGPPLSQSHGSTRGYAKTRLTT